MNKHLRIHASRAFSALGVGLGIATGCGSTPQPMVLIAVSPEPPSIATRAIVPTSLSAIATEEETCPSIGVPLCDAYLRTAAECFKYVPRTTRGELKDAWRRHCTEWRTSASKELWHSCMDALWSILDEPACQLQATTALSSALPAAEPWCMGKSPTPKPDPSGPFEVVVRSKMTWLYPIRSVSVAIDGVGVLMRNLRPDDKADALDGGVLGTFRGRLAPGDHDVRLFVRVRPSLNNAPSNSAMPLVVLQSEQCVTVLDNTALTVTATLYDDTRSAEIPIRPRFDVH